MKVLDEFADKPRRAMKIQTPGTCRVWNARVGAHHQGWQRWYSVPTSAKPAYS